MENKIEKLPAKADWLMTGLKPHPKKHHVGQVTVNFSGYASLFATVTDLMKLCTIALLSEEPHISPLVGNPNIDLARILELAIQLMPSGESEFLDEVRALLDEDFEEDTEQLPVFNFSSVRILNDVAA